MTIDLRISNEHFNSGVYAMMTSQTESPMNRRNATMTTAQTATAAQTATTAQTATAAASLTDSPTGRRSPLGWPGEWWIALNLYLIVIALLAAAGSALEM